MSESASSLSASQIQTVARYDFLLATGGREDCRCGLEHVAGQEEKAAEIVNLILPIALKNEPINSNDPLNELAIF